MACVVLGWSYGFIATGAPAATVVGIAGMIFELAGLIGAFINVSSSNRRRRSDKWRENDSRLPNPLESKTAPARGSDKIDG